jgi:3-oxoacyl-[acyl-carrier protein] reductase
VKLKGRYAVVTGGSHGLGAAIAERFVSEGASVFICARGQSALNEMKDKLSARLAHGQQVLARQADVADPSQVDGMVDAAKRAFPRIDILVNNAGVYGPFGAIEEIEWAEWVAAININVLGTVYFCRAVVPVMKQQRYGKIINLSGGGATSPLPRVSSYAAAKAAVVRFTETLALELKEFGVDVNAIAPGTLATRLTDQLLEAGPERVGAEFYERIQGIRDSGGTPLEKGAALCVYLGSAESDGITGKLLAALWDPWSNLQQHRGDLEGTDIYTLRRIVPKDRGKDWGDV